MRVVLDTNVLLQSLGSKSSKRPIWDNYLDERFELVVTSSILLEYEEILALKTSNHVARNVVSLICEATNSFFIDVHYAWGLITADPDDNKYADAAIAGTADFLVTNDAHFNQLKFIKFPKINVIDADAFLALILRNV